MIEKLPFLDLYLCINSGILVIVEPYEFNQMGVIELLRFATILYY